MYICICKGVSERRIRRAVEDGAVISLRDLSRELGVGTCCGKCVPAARELLESTTSPMPSPALARGLPLQGAALAV